MKKSIGMLKRSMLLSAGLVLLSSLSSAAPFSCAANTNYSLLTLGTDGCYFGSNLFSNFSRTGSNSNPITDPSTVDATLVQVSFNAVGNVINVVASNPTWWTLTSLQQFTLNLQYDVLGSLAYFRTFAESFNSSGVSGTASVDASKCVQDSINNGTPQCVSANLNSPSPAAVAFAAGSISSFHVTDNIQVSAGSNGTVTLSSATNSFVVPEPMTSLLLGSGLLAFGYMLRKRR